MDTSRSRLVLHRIALLAFIAFLGVGIWLRDIEALAFSVAVLVGVFLLPLRKGLLGRVVLGLVFADTLVWMVPAAVSNLAHRDAIECVAVPVVLAAIALAGLAAVVGVASRLVPMLFAGVAVGLIAVSIATTEDGLATHPNDLRVSGHGVSFSPGRLEATSGPVSVRVKNTDLFWHTFTIDELDVDLRIPVKATRRITFDALPGRYEYYCAIPGHDAAGMNGTLVVN